MKIIIASGYFNPLHIGHIDYLEAAKELGDCLLVIVNNDRQVQLKGSRPFMSWFERHRIVGSLRCVDAAFVAMDEDRSVCETLKWLDKQNPGDNLVFANGGDVTLENCREAETCQKLGIELVFGVGGAKKIQSSSALIASALAV